MLLSFIIPLYNCSEYIVSCLNSIYDSLVSEKEFEVIIVNDGSTDNGATVCKKYAEKHKNILLLEQKNSGASTARNKGINHALGKYIWFVDADDRINPDFLPNMLCILQEQHDIDVFCFNHRRIFINHIEEYSEFKNWNICTGLEFLNRHTSNYIWNKIYRRESIGNHRFYDGTKNIEDMYFNTILLMDMDHIQTIPLFGYDYYNINTTSTSRNKNLRNLIKLNQDSISIIEKLIDHKNLYSDFNKKLFLENAILFEITGHLFSLFRFYSPHAINKVIKKYKSLGYYPVKKTYNKRANLFLIIANHKKILLAIKSIANWLHKLKRYKNEKL